MKVITQQSTFAHLIDNNIFQFLASQFALAVSAVLGPTENSPSLSTVKVLWTFKQEQRNCNFCCVCKQCNHYTLAVAVKYWVSAFIFVMWEVHVSKEDWLTSLLLHWGPVILNQYLSPGILNPSKQVSLGNWCQSGNVSTFLHYHLHPVTIYDLSSWQFIKISNLCIVSFLKIKYPQSLLMCYCSIIHR